MKDFELEMQLRETLHESVDHMEADDAMKARIDLMLNNQNTGKSRKVMWKRLTVGVAAALCLTTVGAFARGQLAGLASSLNTDEMRFSVEQLQKDTAKIADGLEIPETLAGYNFQKGAITYVDKLDEEGNRFGTYPELMADYGTSVNADGTALAYTARAYDEELDGEKAEKGQYYEGQPREEREMDGVTVSYQADRYLFLPPDAQPTAEEAELEAKGELYISYGSDAREEQTFQNVTWQKDGVVYQVFTYDDSVTADDLFAAAADALA